MKNTSKSQTSNENLLSGLEARRFRIEQARDYFKRTQELFEQYGSAELKATHASFDELQRALESDQVKVVVVGEFSRGKSALLNALLGIELLQTALEITTAVNTFLQALPSGRKERFIRIHYQDERPTEEIDWNDDQALKRWGTELEKSNAEARRQVSHIEVFFDSNLFKEGLVLIDTPGLNGVMKHHEEITRKAIAEAHVALWVQAAEQLGGAGTEWEFMVRTLLPNFQKFITVINKWDRVLEPEDAHDKLLSEAQRVENKLNEFRERFMLKVPEELKDKYGKEIERLTDKDHLFGVSARWGRDPDPVRRQRSNIDCLAQRIVEMISSGEAQEQIILKPLTQLIDIQSILRDHIESERHQLDSDQSAESRALELKTLELDISELEQEKKRETQESREEHRRALETLQKAMRDRLLKPLTALHDSIEEQVTESYVRRMIANKASTIGLPEELDQQYGQLTRQIEVLWREEKKRLHETLQGLQGSYLEKMNQHAHHSATAVVAQNRLP